MSYFLLVLQLLLAAVMLLAATNKVLNGEQFLEALNLSQIPNSFTRPLAVVVPGIEFCLVLGLLLSPLGMLTLMLALCGGLLVVFTLWMLFVYTQGHRVKCGCFGTGGSDIGPGTISRNALLILIAGSGFFLALHESSPLPNISLWMIMIVSSGCIIFVLLIAFLQNRKNLTLTYKQ